MKGLRSAGAQLCDDNAMAPLDGSPSVNRDDHRDVVGRGITDRTSCAVHRLSVAWCRAAGCSVVLSCCVVECMHGLKVDVW